MTLRRADCVDLDQAGLAAENRNLPTAAPNRAGKNGGIFDIDGAAVLANEAGTMNRKHVTTPQTKRGTDFFALPERF